MYMLDAWFQNNSLITRLGRYSSWKFGSYMQDLVGLPR